MTRLGWFTRGMAASIIALGIVLFLLALFQHPALIPVLGLMVVGFAAVLLIIGESRRPGEHEE